MLYCLDCFTAHIIEAENSEQAVFVQILQARYYFFLNRMCIKAVKYHNPKLDRAELLSLSTVDSRYLDFDYLE